MPHRPEGDPSTDISFSDGLEVTATRYNTTLFTFFGDLAMYNHVFIVVGEDPDAEDFENEIEGRYIFSDDRRYPDLLKFVILNDFPQVLNRNDVLDIEVVAYADQHDPDVAQPEAAYAAVPAEMDVREAMGDFEAGLATFLEDLKSGD